MICSQSLITDVPVSDLGKAGCLSPSRLTRVHVTYFIVGVRQTGTINTMLTEFLSQDELKCLLNYVNYHFLSQVEIFDKIILI